MLLKTRVGRWFLVLLMVGVGSALYNANHDWFGNPFFNGQNDRPHKLNNMRDHDGGTLRILVTWLGQKPQSISIGDSIQPDQLSADQIPDQPNRVQRTYTYHAGHSYIGRASQNNPVAEGPLDCEITLDGVHVDGDRLNHGRGSVYCWTVTA